MSNADIVIRDDITDEQLIDVVLDNRVYLPAFVAINKIDFEKINVETDMDTIYISVKDRYGIDALKRKIFERLELIRIYLRPEGKKIEKRPMVLKEGDKIKDVCLKLHREIFKNFRYAILYGPSASFPRQRVGLSHQLMDGDVITIVSH